MTLLQGCYLIMVTVGNKNFAIKRIEKYEDNENANKCLKGMNMLTSIVRNKLG